MRICIDRFEGKYCVCQDENGNMYEYERKKMPDNAKEGDWLSVEDGELFPDPVYTERIRRRIAEKMKRLSEENNQK